MVPATVARLGHRSDNMLVEPKRAMGPAPASIAWWSRMNQRNSWRRSAEVAKRHWVDRPNSAEPSGRRKQRAGRPANEGILMLPARARHWCRPVVLLTTSAAPGTPGGMSVNSAPAGPIPFTSRNRSYSSPGVAQACPSSRLAAPGVSRPPVEGGRSIGVVPGRSKWQSRLSTRQMRFGSTEGERVIQPHRDRVGEGGRPRC